MTSLAAVLLGHRALPIETVEQAMLRQTMLGGDLTTNLLELGAIDEVTLTQMNGIALELPSAPPGALPVSPEPLRRRILPALPTERVVFPYRDQAGVLCLAVTSRLDHAIQKEFERHLGEPVSPHAALSFRILEAQARDFGTPLPTRVGQLLTLVDGSASNTESTRPLPGLPLPVTAQGPVPPEPPAAEPLRESSVRPAPRARPERKKPARRRGPFTAAMGEAELSRSTSATEALGIWVDFAAQYFEWTALLAVQNRILTLRELRGTPTTTAHTTLAPLPAAPESLLGRTCEHGSFLLAVPSDHPTDTALRQSFDRPVGMKVLCVPVVLRGRVVAVVMGDDGARNVDLSQVGDVLSFTGLVELTLERLLLEKKRRERPRDGEEPFGTATAAPAPPSVAPPAPAPPSVAPPAPAPPSVAPPAPAPPSVAPPAPAPPSVAPPAPAPPSVAPPAPTNLAHFTQLDASDSPPTLRAVADHLPLPSPHADPHSGETLRVPRVVTSSEARITGAVPRDLTPLLVTNTPDGSSRAQDFARISTKPGLNPDPEAAFSETGTRLGLAEDAQLAQAGPPHAPAVAKLALPMELSGAPPSMDYGADCRDLVERLLAGDSSVLPELVELGDRAAAFLSHKLPGPFLNPTRPPRPDGPVRASEASLVLSALVAFGPVARPHVIAKSSDPNAQVRGWATRLLGELPGRQAAIAVARRLVQDRHPEVRRAAFGAAQMLSTDPDAAAALRGALLTTASDPAVVVTQRLAAIDALCDMRDTLAIPDLILLLSDPNPGTAAAAQQALVTLTRQDFGYSKDDWTSFYTLNETRHRLEWLIDALNHTNPTLRQLAAEELHAVSRIYVGDIDDRDEEQRLRVQRKYREWFRTTGGRSVRPPPP